MGETQQTHHKCGAPLCMGVATLLCILLFQARQVGTSGPRLAQYDVWAVFHGFPSATLQSNMHC